MNIFSYHSDTTVNYSEFGKFTIVMSIVPYSRTMLNYGNFEIGTGCRHFANYCIILPQKNYTNPCSSKIGKPLKKFVNCYHNQRKYPFPLRFEDQIFALVVTFLHH